MERNDTSEAHGQVEVEYGEKKHILLTKEKEGRDTFLLNEMEAYQPNAREIIYIFFNYKKLWMSITNEASLQYEGLVV